MRPTLRPKTKTAPSPKKEEEPALLGVESIDASLSHLVFNYTFQKPTIHEPTNFLQLDIEGLQTRAPLLEAERLPSIVSLRKHVPYVYNQGSLGTCVAHSAAQALKIVLERAHSQKYFAIRLLTGSGVYDPSRLYIYYNSRIESGDTHRDIGTTNYGGVHAVKTYKAADEKFWPYEVGAVNRRPSHEAYADAARFKDFEYSLVSQSAYDLEDALAHGAPVMVGVQLGPSFVNCGRDGKISMPDLKRERIIGGHSILLVGYDREKRLFEFVNHWGPLWGDSGFGYIPYDYLTDHNLSGDFYAIEKYR